MQLEEEKAKRYDLWINRHILYKKDYDNITDED